MYRIYIGIFIVFTFGFISCFNLTDTQSDRVVMGLKPIYGTDAAINLIKIQDSIRIENPGKIVYKHPYLFVNEINKGIHIIDNRNPVQIQKLAFISIPFNKDIAVKGDIIYADNNTDLVSIRFITPDSILLVNRVEDAFDNLSAFPVDYTGYFDCIDEMKGQVIGWEKVELFNPKCRTF